MRVVISTHVLRLNVTSKAINRNFEGINETTEGVKTTVTRSRSFHISFLFNNQAKIVILPAKLAIGMDAAFGKKSERTVSIKLISSSSF